MYLLEYFSSCHHEQKCHNILNLVQTILCAHAAKMKLLLNVYVYVMFHSQGDHSLLYFAYTCVWDLFIEGVIYLAKKIIR
jgi:hypothetical protein